MTNEKSSTLASVDLWGSSLRACIEDECGETIELFEGLGPEERTAFAVDAWKIGVRALSAAYREARESQTDMDLMDEEDEVHSPTRLSSLPPTRW